MVVVLPSLTPTR